jgi:glycosyltransferase involved in cell wall biosynthesis
VNVSIIMPTLACRERATSLLRAIDSVVSQVSARGIPLVVVNGPAPAPELLAHLRRRADIRLAVREEGHLPRALHAGRRLVDTSVFAVLDDDDELLPGALRTRLDLLDREPTADVAVTSGYLQGFDRRTLNITDFGPIQADPLGMLLTRHWLPPCAGLFRSCAVTEEFFEAIPRYREWTYLALRLALTLRIRFAEQPTFVYRTDTPDSLSKSRAYALAGPPALRRMLELPLPTPVRARLRARLGDDLHSAAALELEEGNWRAAWSLHLRSLVQPAGWRYLPYGWNLLARTLRPRSPQRLAAS